MPRAGETKDFSFFGEVDLNDKGQIRSDTPAWYFDVHIDELHESMARKKRMVEQNLVEPDVALRMREEIKAEKAKLDAIHDSRPKLTGNQLDLCNEAYKSLGQQISDSLPTRKEDQDGLVSPRDELRRMKSKHISINPQVARACGCKPVNGKISGDEANKCYKILGKHLGESTHVERLRKDGGGEAYKSMNDLARAIFEGREIRGM